MAAPLFSNTATRPTATSPPVTLLGFPTDESQFPQGQCRYILTLPEVRGHRCGCVSFSRNRTVPGVICECGHLACYHMTSPNALSPAKNQGEIDLLRDRLRVLEQQIRPDGYEQETMDQTVRRVALLEDLVEKHHEESRTDMKSSYKHMSAAWHLVEQLQKRLSACEQKQRHQAEQLEKDAKFLKELQDRSLELLEADEMLEERIEQLQDTMSLATSSSTLELNPTEQVAQMADDSFSAMCRRRPSVSDSKSDLQVSTACPTPPADTTERVSVSTSSVPPSKVWTLDVSILPSRKQPFPFEKDTAAYKRCLSRGLQRIVAVEDSSAEAISTAISKAFQHVLQGCQWEPLEAKVCDAKKLEGLPMLRPLDGDTECNMSFIRENCAVCDGGGRIQSLYVALKQGKLSWSTIRSLPVSIDGLESSWAFDKYLDEEGENDENREQDEASSQPPSSASQTITLKGSLSLKRPAETDATVSSMGASSRTEPDGPRTNKVARTCAPDVQVESRLGMKAAL